MGEFRAKNECNATFFSPQKVKHLQELEQTRQDEKALQQQGKAKKAQNRESRKFLEAPKMAERKAKG